MSKQDSTVMTAKQFATKMEVNYRTALNWLEAGLVPGAVRKASPIGEYWEVPASASGMVRPKLGRKAKKASD
jgi:predicted site-specific integrase-resolvase